MSCNDKFTVLCVYQGEDYEYLIENIEDDLTDATVVGGFRLDDDIFGTPFTCTVIDASTVQISLTAEQTAGVEANTYQHTVRATTSGGKRLVLIAGDIIIRQSYF